MRSSLPIAVAALIAAVASSPLHSAESPTPEEALDRAFANRYGIGLSSTIELVLETKAGATMSRTIETVSTLIEGRMHSIGRLTQPEHLRGMTILSIEAKDRNHDAFLYLPSSQMVRRVSTAQRGDSFFGTDVTYEDLERQRSSDFRSLSMESITWNDETALVVEGRPKQSASFAKVRFFIASSDSVILRTEYFKQDAEDPYRVVEINRKSVRSKAGHAIPTRFVVRNRLSDTRTTVVLRDLTINPQIDPNLFSLKTLASERRIPIEAP